jgi:predicted Fe-Mo cluster-binding NifX family protein
MKIAVTSQGEDMNSEVDPRFGRAKRFIVLDTDTGEHRVVDNTQNLNAVQGAGVQAAQAVVELGVEAVLTGNCGPKAFRVLETAGIKLYLGVEGEIRDAVAKLEAGEYKPADNYNVEGHW